MAGQAVKRRVTSSTAASQPSSRPPKRLRTSSGGWSDVHAPIGGVGQHLARAASWVMGKFTRPRGGANSITRPKTSATADKVIDFTQVDDEDEEDDSRRKQTLRKQAREARSHLNDLAVVSPPVAAAQIPAIHPNLPKPLFHSSFDSPEQPRPSGAPRPPPESVNNRPDVGDRRRGRSYAWAQPVSPGSTSSRSSSASGDGRTISHRRSRRNLRDSAGARDQQRLLLQYIERGEAAGDPHVHAYKRVYEEHKREMEEEENRRLRASQTHHDLEQERLHLSFDELRLDRRETLDEALTPSRQQKYIPRPFVSRHRLPVPVESHDSFLREKIQRERDRVEQQLRARLETPIPKDVTSAQASIVESRLRDRSFEAAKGNATVSSESLRRLRPTTWLNDEVVNFYAELINSRAKATGQAVHCMNSYFYQKLSEDGYERANLKRWTKRMKLDIFALDKLLVPINLGNVHWVCAVINFKSKRMEYYDSMRSSGQYAETFEHLRGYLESEHKEKKGSSYDLSDWEDYFSNDTPKQNNASDCGVFSCQTLESAARGRDLSKVGFEFSAKNMPFFRRLMIVEIASGELASRSWGV